MRYARIIFACLISFSVAMLPAANAFATIAKSADLVVSESMPDCCNHEALPCDNCANDTGICAMASCMAKCFSYAGAVSAGVLFAPAASQLRPSLAESVALLNIANLPFRPPRV
jgi:hypothetical protein